MSKYIIELKDDVQVVQKVGVTENGNAFVMNFYKDQLEELTSDYINEHYGDLQDTAYQRGLEDGKQTAIGAAELREKLEYQKGFKDGKAQVERGCEGCEYEHREDMGTPCEYCSKNYKNLWKAKDDKIVVGDEVETKSGKKYVVVSFGNYMDEEKTACGFNADGYWYGAAEISTLCKTGRHFDISSILKEMQS